MSTPSHLRSLARRNARLLAAAELPPAPKNPVPSTRGRLDGNGRLQRSNSMVERKRVPEDVGCTISPLDYLPALRGKATGNSRPNSGRKGDPQFGRQVGAWKGTKVAGDTRYRKG